MISKSSEKPLFTHSEMDGSPKLQAVPFLIGERLNTLGSRIFKQIIEEERWDDILPLARQQIANGAQALDVCVALAGKGNESETMKHVLQVILPAVKIPLCIDSTDPGVMEAALEINSDRSLLNSTHLEMGRSKADQVFTLAKQFNAAVIILTIDEQGMAMTASKKIEVARRLYEIAVGEYKIPPHDLFFDPLTFTLATGDPAYENSAQETLQAIREIKSLFPGVNTSLGISNVSFGFPPEIRVVINNIMLHYALQYGLDAAIFNPAHLVAYDQIDPEPRRFAEDLIFNRPDALRKLVMYYKKQRQQKKEQKI